VKRLALDGRSVGVGRIAIALLLGVDLVQRALDLRAHYTDDGVLPRSAYELLPWDFAWSLHRLGGSVPFEAGLFALAAVSAVALGIGFRTRWATLACWLLTTSLHARNPLLRDGQDDLIRVMLFWGLFLPLGAAFSLDARLGKAPAAMPIAGSGFAFQLCVLYWVSALGKLLSPWWRAGDGLFFALRVGRYETAVGQWLADKPGLAFLSWAVLALEALGPVVWLVSRDWRVRTGAVAALVALQLGLGGFMRLGLFPWVNVAALLFLLPAGFWERLGTPAPQIPAREPRPLAIAAGVAAAIVVWCNALYLVPFELPRWPQRVAEGVGLQQYWVLFSPRRSTPFSLSDGWLVVSAVLKSGKQVEVRSGGPVSWDRPALISQTFGGARWRHYFANMANLLLPFPRGSTQYDTLEKSRAAYAHYLCREWNGNHSPEDGIAYLSLFLARYRFDHPAEPAQRELLFQDACL
jgi:hypothetical protein